MGHGGMLVALLALMVVMTVTILSSGRSAPSSAWVAGPEQALPSPRVVGTVSLEEALAARRSVREFTAEPLTLDEIGQLLWAAQGVTDGAGRRTAPSAGGLYPLELDVVTPDGMWRYVPDGHRLVSRGSADLRADLQAAALGQAAVGDAPLVIVISGLETRTAVKYGDDRAPRYVALEAGHAAQNVLLEAVALGLGGVPIGAFDDAEVRRVLDLPYGHAPLYLLPVGHPG